MVEFRVMTWNLRGTGRPDLDEVAGRILAAHPDVVGIQEVRRGQAAKLASRLRWHHHWALKHFSYGPLTWLAEGMAVLSPHPMPLHTRTVLNPHARPWSYRRRIMQRAVLGGPHGPISIVNAHLASHESNGERAQQAEVLAGEVRRNRDDNVITLVIGDLNAADEPTTLAPLEAAGLTDAWRISEDATTAHVVRVHEPRRPAAAATRLRARPGHAVGRRRRCPGGRRRMAPTLRPPARDRPPPGPLRLIR